MGIIGESLRLTIITHRDTAVNPATGKRETVCGICGGYIAAIDDAEIDHIVSRQLWAIDRNAALAALAAIGAGNAVSIHDPRNLVATHRMCNNHKQHDETYGTAHGTMDPTVRTRCAAMARKPVDARVRARIKRELQHDAIARGLDPKLVR